MWPGFGDNLRVLNWIVDRCDGKVDAKETAIGYMPYEKDINTNGLDISADTLSELLSIDKEVWKQETGGIKEFFGKFGDRLPEELNKQLATLEENLNK